MAKKIMFPLKMKNGAEVRTLDELKENFDLESVLGYFADGRLTTWLAVRHYDDKVATVSALSMDTTDLNAKLCEILEVEYQSEEDSTDLKSIQRRNEKLRILSTFTGDKEIISNIDIVAMNQNEFFDILDRNPERVFLFGEKFNIPFNKKNVCYIGVNNPLVILEKEKLVYEYNKADIIFKNVRFDEQATKYLSKGEALYINNNFDEAIPYIEIESENNDPRALYMLAMAYKNGSGVEADLNKCYELLNCANGLGEPLSMMNYAYHCCKYDFEKREIFSEYAEKLKDLADSGDILAKFEYGDYLCNYSYDNKESGVSYIKEAAVLGFVPAKFSLGNLYYKGLGVDFNKDKAYEWYEKAALQGYAPAQHRLGEWFESDVVTQDKEKSIEWYKKAALQGYVASQYKMGLFIYWMRMNDIFDNIFNNINAINHTLKCGVGFNENELNALEWFEKAANQGHREAQYMTGLLYKENKNASLAISWFVQAAKQEHVESMYQLGLIYENGYYGVLQNKSLSRRWYKSAAKYGHKEAKKKTGILGILDL